MTAPNQPAQGHRTGTTTHVETNLWALLARQTINYMDGEVSTMGSRSNCGGAVKRMSNLIW